MNKGWECPKCGNVYSPIFFECQSCNKKVTNIDCGNEQSTICEHVFVGRDYLCKKCGLYFPET